MKQLNNEFILEDFSFQPSELDFSNYVNSLPYGERGSVERTAYNEREQAISVKFKNDALIACGILGHKRADAAFSLAWETGHSAGLQEVFFHLQDYANLIRGLK